MRYCALLLLLNLYGQCIAQDPAVSSLSQIASGTGNDSLRVAAMNKIALHYVFNDRQKALRWLKRSELLSIKKRLRFGYAEAMNFRGIFSDVSGDKDSSQYYFRKALALGQKYKLPNIEVRATNNLGMASWTGGDFNEALRYFFSALRLNEHLPKDQQISNATCYSNIGLIYQEMNLYGKALPWHLKAYTIWKRDDDIRNQGAALNNIGVCYKAMHRASEAYAAYEKAITAAVATGNEIQHSQILSNYGNALQEEGKVKEAIPLYSKVLAIRAVSPKTFISVSGNMAAAYNSLGKPKVALSYIERGLDTLKLHPDSEPFSESLYQFAAQSHYMLGHIKEGELNNWKFTEIVNKNFADENARQAAKYEIKYNTAQKERQLAENKARLLSQQADARQKSYVLTGISMLAVFIVFISVLVYRQQKARNLQLQHEHELKTAIAHIEAQNQLQEQRLGISRDLHDNIGAQLTFIISGVENIRHAFEIGNPSLTDRLDGIGNFAKTTIIELRDTIWAMNHEQITFEDLRARILNFIEKARGTSRSTQFKFQIDDGLRDIALSSIVGMNVYRSVQEAVNNAVKYAAAGEVAVEAYLDGEDIVIEVRDNGSGFNKDVIERGNGLYNMEKRMEDIGGRFSLSSEPGKGTAIVLRIRKSENPAS